MNFQCSEVCENKTINGYCKFTACVNPKNERNNYTMHFSNPQENKKMSLIDYLRQETGTHELCVIRQRGWIVATCWIDSEDIFMISDKIANEPVKGATWDYLPIVNENECGMKIPCRYIDI